MTPIALAPLERVRTAIANAIVVGAEPALNTAPVALGQIVLLPAQRETLRHVRRALAQFGGVLVANDVGSGKTFVALAAASAYQNPLVLAPAALRTMWAGAMRHAARELPFVSIESLGRGRSPPCGHDFVVVDEAHHLRNAATRTYRAASASARGAKVVLLTATPVHNRAADLTAMLALFLGADAHDLTDEARSRIIVRASQAVAGPRVITHAAVAIREDRALLREIVRLPPPVPARDGAIAAMLLRFAILRAWCSSAGACSAVLRRAYLRTAALIDAARAGRHLTRRELAAWSPEGGQLAFAEIIAPAINHGDFNIAAAQTHLDAIAALHARTLTLSAFDDDRATRLCDIADRHRGIPVLACTQYAGTVDALWSRLRGRPETAALTSAGARIASGALTRDNALARFAPSAQGAPMPHERERIRLLVATDLVSEGVNLHDAGVVVHLDLPWTAARLAQRVGRIARFGSPHSDVHAYSIAPPRAAAAALALSRRIRAKRRLAARLVGGEERFAELVGGGAPVHESSAEARARISRLLEPFVDAHANECAPTACGVGAPQTGWLALVGPESSPRLVACLGTSAPTTDPRTCAIAIEWITAGRAIPVHPESVWSAAGEASRWLARDRAHILAGTHRPHAARARGRALATTVAAISATPPHQRASAARDAAATIQSLSRPIPHSPDFPLQHSPARPLLQVLVVFSPHARNAPPRPPF